MSSRVLNSSMRACALFSFIFSFFLECFPIEVGISFLERFDACLDDGESFLLFHCSFLSSFLPLFSFLGLRPAFCAVDFHQNCLYSIIFWGFCQVFCANFCVFCANFLWRRVAGFLGGWIWVLRWWVVWVVWVAGLVVWGGGRASKTPQNTPKPVKTNQNSVGVSPRLFF